MQTWARRVVSREGGELRRPLGAGLPGDLEVAWVRTGPPGGTPVVVLPGGPGMASVLPYEAFRRRATRQGLDVIMVEHRGVGLSGRTTEGDPVPREAVTVEAAADDTAAVLTHLDVERAVVVGSSYGTYLAQAVAVRHPHLVQALVLDSPILSVADDLAATRAHRRELLWDGRVPQTAHVAALVRQVAEAGEPMAALSHVVQVTYELAGPEVLAALLRARLDGHLGWAWDRLSRLGIDEIDGDGLPCWVEPGPVVGIAFGQLGYGLPPDGGPLDPQLAFQEAAARQPPFRGEPLDLVAEARRYPWPTVVVCGDRDLRTPPPVAARLVDLAPGGVLARLTDTGHGALDLHQLALVDVVRVVRDGRTEHLDEASRAWNALSRKGISGQAGSLVERLVRELDHP